MALAGQRHIQHVGQRLPLLPGIQRLARQRRLHAASGQRGLRRGPGQPALQRQRLPGGFKLRRAFQPAQIRHGQHQHRRASFAAHFNLRAFHAMRQAVHVKRGNFALHLGRQPVERHFENAPVALLRGQRALHRLRFGEHDGHVLPLAQLFARDLALVIAHRLAPALHIRHQQIRRGQRLRAHVGLRQLFSGAALAVAALANQPQNFAQRNAQHKPQHKEQSGFGQQRIAPGRQAQGHVFFLFWFK